MSNKIDLLNLGGKTISENSPQIVAGSFMILLGL